MLLDPRNGPAFDHAPAPGARTYVIASTPRTGSTMLARWLWQLGVGAPKEYFNPTQIRDWEVRLGNPVSRRLHRLLGRRTVPIAGQLPWTTRRIEHHLERVRQRRTQGGWFGLKIHWHHFARTFASDPGLLGEVTWIHVFRDDRLAQAVSWDRALQSHRWSAEQTALREPVYDRTRIRRRLEAIDAHEAHWAAFFAGRDALHISYEALCEQGLGPVLDHLGVDAAPGAPPTRVQQGPSDWSARYLAGR